MKKIVGFGLKAPNFEKMMLMAHTHKVDIMHSLIFLRSLKIAQIQNGRQCLYNKKKVTRHMHISTHLKEGKTIISYHKKACKIEKLSVSK